MSTLVSLNTVKAFLQIDPHDTRNDGVILGLLQATDARFKKAVGWEVVSTQYVDIRDDLQGEEYTFRMAPVTAVASVQSLADFATDTWDTISTSDWRLRHDGRGRYYVRYPGGFGYGTEYKITYTAGYGAGGADNIPTDIQSLVATFAAISYWNLPISSKGLLPHLQTVTKSQNGVAVSENYVTPMAWWNEVVKHYKVYAI